LQDTNLLLLDEPTNHLDIPSQEILEQVLEAYAGTIILVSHDRYLIDALGTQIWEIDPDDSRLTVFKGTYSELRAQQETAAQATHEQAADKKAESRPTHPASNPTKEAVTPSRRSSGKEERRKKAKLQELENAIAALESNLADIGRALETPATPEEVRRLGQEYASLQQEMDAKLAEWEQLQG
jgi:ATP-binding cassette, subfamily F, member 3